jgi:hypothetical protein
LYIGKFKLEVKMSFGVNGAAAVAGESKRIAAGKWLMISASIGAAAAFGGSVEAVRNAGAETFWVESWRMGGLFVFAGLFLMLAVKPRNLPGVWEAVFFHKVLMAVLAAFNPQVKDALVSGIIDAVLAVFILSAYILSKGWLSWKRAGGE